MTIEWEPWHKFAQDSEALPISEPPCRHCKYWTPRRKYRPDGRFDGVVICSNIGEQCNDFSCFKPRES